MKTSGIVLIALIGVAVYSASCTRENGYIHPTAPAPPDTSTHTTPPTSDSTYSGVVTGNFQPSANNSTWTYQVHQVFDITQSTLAQVDPTITVTFQGSKIDSTAQYTVQSLGFLTPVGPLNYMAYSNDYGGGAYNPAVAISNNNYFGADVVWEVSWLGGSVFGGFTLNNDTLLYLEVQPKGTTWNETTIVQDVLGFADTTAYSFVIKDTGITRTVNNITYPHVIWVESSALPGSLAQYAALFALQGINVYITTEYYYAENVGLIEEDLSQPFVGVSLVATLQSSSIK